MLYCGIVHKDYVIQIDKYVQELEKKARNTEAKFIRIVGADADEEHSYPIDTTAHWDDFCVESHRKNLLREDVEFFLGHPEVFKKYNILHKRAYFLYGPPGNGKTMFIKILATEYPKLSFFSLDFDANVMKKDT